MIIIPARRNISSGYGQHQKAKQPGWPPTLEKAG